MPNSRERIEVLAREFVDQLKAIAKEELVQLLGNGEGGQGREEPNRSTKPKKNGVAKRGRTRAPGEKRSPAELEALQGKVVAFLKDHPDGLRVEQLNQTLGTAAGELARPIKKLLAAKEIRTTGARRATRYFVAGGGKKSGSRKKKATKKD